MFFDTPIYFVFLVLVVSLYWGMAHGQQNRFLLVASYFFYGWWDWRFLGLILVSTVVDYHCARWIASSEDSVRRRSLLALSLVVNLSFLGFFKYFNFFVDSLVAALHSIGVTDVHVTTLRILLPPGISFYTFQAVAYIVDVYRGKLAPSRSLVEYALFISLFPHLIAGPIQQPAHLLPQVERRRHWDDVRFFDGLMLIVMGLFKKCVVADNCALLANAAFAGTLGPSTGWTLMIGAYAFAWQIYGDFSGYSDIARGSAQLLGFHFMVNFRQPYLACTVQDFWKRWHISLSTWLRDYLYLPVNYWMGRRWPNVSWFGLSTELWIYLGATVVTMLLGGLWHGANWTFVAWGGFLALAIGIERIFWTAGGPRGPKNPLRRPAFPLLAIDAWLLRLTVFHAVCLSWVLFRSESFDQAWTMLGGIGDWTWRPGNGTALAFIGAFAVPLFALDLLAERTGDEYPFASRSYAARLSAAFAGMLVITVFSANDLNAFVYFQF